MSGQATAAVDIERLTGILWPDGDRADGPQVHWLLDGARDPAILGMLRQGKLEYTCLYEGRLSSRLQTAAPYLVHLSAGSPTTVALLERGWGRGWGIFCVADPHVTSTRLRLHFKKLLRVRTEDGKLLAFRFYDPQVFASFFQIATREQRRQLIGPVSRIVFETAGSDLARSVDGGDGASPAYARAQENPAAALAVPDLASLARLCDGEGAPLSFEQVLGVLHRAGWDAGAVLAVLPELTRRLQSAPLAVQRQWFGAVRANWPRIAAQAAGGKDDPAFALGLAAGRLQWWSMAAFCFAASLETGDHAATRHNLAAALWQLGRHEEAEQHLRQATAAAPGEPAHGRQLAALHQWRRSCRQRLGGERLLAYLDKPQAIHATLLGPHHARALLSRQDDPELIRLARLMRHAGTAQAREWIAAQNARAGKLPLALLHPEFGMIGACVIERHGEAALFHYWIGAAFQSQGHGGTALRLLKRIALRFRIRYLFSTVFDTNTRSLSAMQRAGFARMEGVTESAGERLPYYCLVMGRQAVDGDERFGHLQALLRSAGVQPALRRTEPHLEACA